MNSTLFISIWIFVGTLLSLKAIHEIDHSKKPEIRNVVDNSMLTNEQFKFVAFFVTIIFAPIALTYYTLSNLRKLFGKKS